MKKLRLATRMMLDGLELLAIHDYSALPDWADDEFYLAAESSSIAGDWKTLPYQRGIMQILSDEDVPIISWQKCAQIGATKMITADIFYHSVYKHRNCLIYQPTNDEAKSYTQEEIDPVLKNSQIGEHLKCKPSQKHKDNTNERKGFTGSLLDIRGGKSERNYRRLTKDRVYYDDLDGFDHDIDGAGSPVSLGDDRISTSSFKKSIRISTPRVEETSQIIKSISQADVVLKRYLPCPHCYHNQTLEWKNFAQDSDGYRLPAHACVECGAEMRYEQLHDADKKGHWSDGKIILNEKTGFLMDGKKPVFVRHVGFILWTAYSYFVHWEELVGEFNHAKKQLKTGDHLPLKTFVNTKLAQGWKEIGEAPEDEQVRKHKLPRDPGIVPDDAFILTMGVDVQKDRVYYECRAWGANFATWQIYHGELFGNTGDINDLVWSRLKSLIKTPVQNHPIKLVLIDSGYNADAVYEFCRNEDPVIFPAKGMKSMQTLVRRTRVETTFNGKKTGIKLWLINTSYFKTFVHNKINLDPGTDGCWNLNRATTDDYCLSVIAEHQIETKPGSFVWKQIHARNDYLDTGVYNTAAAHILGIQTMKRNPKTGQKKRKKIDTEKYWDQ